MKNYAKILSAAIAIVVALPAVANAETKTEQPAKKPLTTSETPIGELLADPAAKAVVDKYIPGLSENPSIGMASAMTLRAIQPMAGDKIKVEQLDAIDAELAKLPAK